jgi:hypothetical protein
MFNSVAKETYFAQGKCALVHDSIKFNVADYGTFIIKDSSTLNKRYKLQYGISMLQCFTSGGRVARGWIGGQIPLLTEKFLQFARKSPAFC